MTTNWVSRGMALVFSLGALGAAGCSSGDSVTVVERQTQGLGRLHLPLVTSSEDRFRLRSATFDVVNLAETRTVTLSSELDPDATSLDTVLPQDSYSITLQGGWVLERLAADATIVPVHAALLTANPTLFDIADDQSRSIIYSFTTDEGRVDFGEGALRIAVDVTPSQALAGCELTSRSSCPEGQTCLIADSMGRTFCAAPGALPVGSPCSSEQCVAGAQCLRGLDPAQPDAGQCMRFCNTSSSFCGCESLSFDADVGVCSQVVSGFIFSGEFSGSFDPLLCAQWNDFKGQLGAASFSRVTLSGNLGPTLECNDPTAATQICNLLSSNSGFGSNVICDGHNWSVGECGGTELTVDNSFCSCAFPGNTVRPCSSNGSGVGTATCSQVPQTIEVTCE